MIQLRMIAGGLIAAFALAELFVISEPDLPSYISLSLLIIAGAVTGD
jgi:hypothetical protein